MNFRDRVIKIVSAIPYGRVTTYGTITILAGMPKGARLVGGILHYNYEKHNLPWHRVINRHGFISIKCLDHPKELQRALLEQEGVQVSNEFMVDLNKFGWFGYEKSLDNSKLEIK